MRRGFGIVGRRMVSGGGRGILMGKESDYTGLGFVRFRLTACAVFLRIVTGEGMERCRSAAGSTW
jgi:hypothetical protein